MVIFPRSVNIRNVAGNGLEFINCTVPPWRGFVPAAQIKVWEALPYPIGRTFETTLYKLERNCVIFCGFKSQGGGANYEPANGTSRY
jgi:hypothetical protein